MSLTPEQFLLLADPLPEPMLLLASDGLILAGNLATERRLGIAARQLVGQLLSQVITNPQDVVGHFLRACSRSRSLVLGALDLKAGVGETVACRAEGSLLQSRADGQQALLLMRLIPKKSAVGQFVSLNQRIDSLGQEVWRRKRAEEEARQQAESLRVTLWSIGDGVMVTDDGGCVVSLNPVAEALTGWVNDEAAGLHLDHVFRIVNEDTGQPVANPALRAIEEGQIIGLANHTILIAKDGAHRYVDDSAAPIRDENGKVRGAILVFRDISARRLAEAALRESETKLQHLADTIPQLAWMARQDGHIFWYNRRWHEYTGATPEQMEVGGWESFHDPAQLPLVKERWQDSITSGAPFDMVFPLKGADGQFRPFLTRVNPLQDDSGKILYWFGTNTDISEIKRMEDALRQADRRKDEFLATLAHELRNPLAPILNSLQILKMPSVDAETACQTREMMERQVIHLMRLVDDLLDVSRVMQGKISLHKEKVELATIFTRAVDIAQQLIKSQNHKLHISVPTPSLLLDADPVRLTQVFANLLVNSAKYSKPNSPIWLTARRDGAQAVVSVKDSGVGIAPDMLPHVFDLFVQADHASSKAQGGLGVGLTLVKKLVEMHDGTIEAHSEGLGKGCDFVCRLALSSPENLQNAVTQSGSPQQFAPGHRLLVVDDNQDAAVSLAMLLRLLGHQVWLAHNGSDALEMAATLSPDMIFLDIGMPGMDGYEAARRLRQQAQGKHTVLAALTGWDQQAYRSRAAEVGFDHYLVKPLDPNVLESLMANLKTQPD